MGRTWIVPLITLFLVAGCVDPTEGPSSPRRGAGKLSLERPSDPNSVPHVHDEWGNETRKMILESKQGGGSAGGSQNHRFPSLGKGSPVISGTEEMRVTVYFNQTGGDPLDITFDYRPAQETEWRNHSFEYGVPFSIIVPPEWVDPPHSRSSYWDFAFGFHFRSPDGGSVNFNSHTVVEVLRTSGELLADPPHPERWFGASAALLLDLGGPLKDSALPVAGSAPPRFIPSSQAPLSGVPWNTSKVEVVLFYNSSTPAPLHYSPTMSFRGPEGGLYSFEFQDVPANESSTGESGFFRWTWNIDERFWDSPYAEESLWSFDFRWAGLLPTPICCFERPSEMDGDYRLIMEAVR